jgi:anti-sigma regulatory factor (Ser/Thr protein kinase)
VISEEPPEELILIGTITLPGTRRSVAYARSFLRDLLPPGDPVQGDVVLVGSETVCNAVAHTASGLAGGKVTITLAAGCGMYRLEVADEGAAGARPCLRPESGAESGRGLRIVNELSLRWGFHEDGDRTIVWAEFPGPTGP